MLRTFAGRVDGLNHNRRTMMKRLIMAVGFAMTVSLGNAAWFENNPDHTTSIGVSTEFQNLSGDSSLTSGMLNFKQPAKSKFNAIVADAKIPVSDITTFKIGLSYITSETAFDETPALTGGKAELDGVGFSVGVRFYLGGRQQQPSQAVQSHPVKNWNTLEDTLSNEELISEMKERGLIPK